MASAKKKAATTTKKAVKKKTTKRAPAKKAASSKRLRVRQVRSGIGSSGRIRRTLAALGLRRHQSETTVPDNPSIQGMLRKVQHLVRVVGEEQ